jgi:hypothetical protein
MTVKDKCTVRAEDIKLNKMLNDFNHTESVWIFKGLGGGGMVKSRVQYVINI